jgi:hypothetical protein
VRQVPRCTTCSVTVGARPSSLVLRRMTGDPRPALLPRWASPASPIYFLFASRRLNHGGISTRAPGLLCGLMKSWPDPEARKPHRVAVGKLRRGRGRAEERRRATGSVSTLDIAVGLHAEQAHNYTFNACAASRPLSVHDVSARLSHLRERI